MGCKGSKASAAKSAKAPSKPTLLNTPTEKPAVGESAKAALEIGAFNIFIDGLSASGCLASSEDGAMLRVVDVKGGPIGLWNNRALTEKVKVGDFIVKVRKAGPSSGDWLYGDASLMLGALLAEGPFEVQFKRGITQEPEKPVQQQQLLAGEQVEEALPTEAAQVKEEEAVAIEVARAKEEAEDIEAPLQSSVEAAVETPSLPFELSEGDGNVNKGSCGFFGC